MRRNHLKLVFLVIVLLSLLFTSCQEESGTGNLKIILQPTGISKSILPENNAGRIVKYSVAGKGPNNKTFSKDSSSRTVTIEGLSNGDWEISAMGLTNQGNIVASGTKTINFSGSSSSAVIDLDSDIGSGNLNLQIDWDSAVTNPFIKISIEGICTAFSKENTYQIKQGECSYNAVYKDLQSGYYLVKILLFNDEIKISGICESVRIINTITTSGTVSFKNTERTNSDSLKLNLISSDNYNVSGSLEDIDNQLIIGEEYELDFVLSSSLVTSDLIKVNWYVDGVKTSSSSTLSPQGASFKLKAEKGRHIVNIVLTDEQCKTCESACFRYYGKNEDAKGTAILVSSINPSNNQKIKLDSSTKIGVLPNNRIIVLSPASNTMQLCHIYETGLLLETNGTYSSTMEDFGFISDAELFETDSQMTHFAITDSKKNITILKYNEKKDIISLALRAADDRVAKFTGYYPLFNVNYNDINSIALYRDSNLNGTILFTDSITNNIFSVNTLPEGTTTENLTFKDLDYPICPILSAGFGNIFYFSGNILFYSNFNGKVATNLWDKITTSIEEPYKILCINSENILLVGKKKIKRIRIDKSIGIIRFLDDVIIDTTDSCLTPDCTYMYSCSSDGKLYSYATDYVGNFKRLDVCQTDGKFKQVVSNQNNVIAVSEDGSLYIFEISEGE